MKNSLRKFLTAIEILPTALPTALATFGFVAIVFLLFDNLRSYYVWPLGVAAAFAAVYTIAKFYPHIEKSRTRHICNVLVVIGVLLWGAVNVFYTAEHTITNRDPGTYTNAAIWLTEHNSLKIGVDDDAFGDVEGVSPTSPGFVFAPDGENLLAQGMHLLPVLLGLLGRIVGVDNMLHLNVLFGMSSLLAVYAFARAFIRPYWSLLPTAALAASMPMIYFSRDTYTEPLAATFTFGALALLWVAIKSKRIPIWFLAGLVAGAGTLTRIDGYLVVGALIFVLGIAVALSKKNEWSYTLKASIAMILGMAIISAVAWLDLSQLSTFYYVSERDGLIKEAVAVAAALVFGVVAAVVARRTELIGRLDKLTLNWRAAAGAAGALVVMILLAARPMWLVAKGPEGARSFHELSMEWIGWYIGPPLALLGAAGIVLAIYYVLKKRNLFLLASLAVICGTALVYIVKPSIAADHTWAARRFLPVILPGVAVFGGFILDRLSKDYLKRLQWEYVFVGLASIAIVLAPLLTSDPILKKRDIAFMQPVRDVCAALPDNAAVLWIGAARSRLVQPTAGICEVPSEGYGDFFKEAERPGKNTLAAAARNAERNGYVAVIGLYGNQVDSFPGIKEKDLTLVSTYSFNRLEKTFINPPRSVIGTTGTIFLGVIEINGAIRPI